MITSCFLVVFFFYCSIHFNIFNSLQNSTEKHLFYGKTSIMVETCSSDSYMVFLRLCFSFLMEWKDTFLVIRSSLVWYVFCQPGYWPSLVSGKPSFFFFFCQNSIVLGFFIKKKKIKSRVGTVQILTCSLGFSSS